MNRAHDDSHFTYESLADFLGRHVSSIKRYVTTKWPDETESKQCTLYLIWYLKNAVRKYNMNLVFRKNPTMTPERLEQLKKQRPYLEARNKK